MSDDQNISININTPAQPAKTFVPPWLRWFGIWLIVLAVLSLARQCS